MHKLPSETAQRDLARQYSIGERCAPIIGAKHPRLGTQRRGPKNPQRETGHRKTQAMLPRTPTVHHNHICTRRHGFIPTVHSHLHSHFHPPPTLSYTFTVPATLNALW
jgi:hypothetical protein